MRASTMLAVTGLALLTTSAAATAATLIPVVPFPGSAASAVYGINANNIIVGNWFDVGGIEHGYFGTLAGSYTTFDYTGNTAMGTAPRAINDSGLITGYGPTDGSGSFLYGPEFEYDSTTGKMKTIVQGKNNPVDGIVQGISSAGIFAGDHWVLQGNNYIRYGYLGKNAKWQQDLSIFGSSRVAARGINKSGIVVGYFYLNDNIRHGFILQNGVATQIDFPDASVMDTYLEGINDKGLVTGQWDDTSGSLLPYGFTLDINTNTFKSIKIPGSTQQAPWEVNNAGLIAVNSDVGSFIYCPKKPSNCPSSGKEVADGRSITVPRSIFRQYVVHRSANAKSSAITSRDIMQRRTLGGPALP